MNDMLGKDIVEVVDIPGLVYHSLLFQVQKVTGGWKPVVDLAALKH